MLVAMRRTLLPLIFALALSCGRSIVKSPAFPVSSSCDDAPHHRLDFWIGEWEVTNPSGGREGSNVIEKVEGGCAVRERWTEASGGTGESLFFFDASLGRWKQVWVTSEGGFKEKRELDDASAASIRFEGSVPRPAGGRARDRTTLTKLDDGRVRQVIEQSIDDGATWKRWEGIYTRKQATSACAAPEHRQFDFWIGDWDLVVRAKTSPGSEAWSEAHATNEVRATYGGCAIEEHFVADGPGGAWAGHSISTFADGKWRQTWVDDQGSYMPFVGAFTGGEMILEGEPKVKDGRPFRMRMVFTAITANALKWRWERTEDDGASWRPTMTIDYSRRR